MKIPAFIIGIALMLSACEHKVSTQEVKLMEPPPSMTADKEVVEKSIANGYKAADLNIGSAQNKQADTAKKITKTGDISFETGDINQTRKSIIQSVQKAGGYIAEDSQSKDESTGRKEYVLKIRIPSKNFDSIMDTISGTADKIDSRNISIKDVTTEYIDIKTRLDNKRKLEASYLTLLNKANKMADILQIEAKLAEIRSDVESTQGQLNYLDKQVAYSSLDITFYTKYVVAVSGDGFVYRFKNALSGGWDWLQGLFFGLISIWPIVIVCFVLYFILHKYFNAKRRNKVVAE